MRAYLTMGVAAAALLAAGAAQAKGPKVEIKDAAARVVVIPEARDDIQVEMLTTNPGLPLVVRDEGDRTVVDGDLRFNAIRGCRTVNGATSVNVRGKTYAWDDLPQVVVRVPLDAQVAADGAVFGSVGRTRSLTLSNGGCGDWTIGNVEGDLALSLAGSGDAVAGTAGSAAIRIAGSGDVATASLAGPLSVNIAGSGDVSVASVAGDVEAKIAGSGDVAIRGGEAGAVSVSIAGSGDVTIAGPARSVDAKVAGSGDVRVVRVSGPVTKRVAGSGEVIVGPIDQDD
ncbi:MAG: GIN domain-containing protein [Pseudomonadota bacterium]